MSPSSNTPLSSRNLVLDCANHASRDIPKLPGLPKSSILIASIILSAFIFFPLRNALPFLPNIGSSAGSSPQISSSISIRTMEMSLFVSRNSHSILPAQFNASSGLSKANIPASSLYLLPPGPLIQLLV